MALLKDLIVNGASRFIGDAYFNAIKSGVWNGTKIAVTYGGTGSSTAPTAWGIIYAKSTSEYASTAAGTSGQYLKSNGSAAPTWATFSASTVGLGNVENTKLSTWTGSTNITTLGTIATGTWNATAIGVTKGGTGLTSIAINSLLYASAANTLSALAPNTANATKVLTSKGDGTNGGVPTWSALSTLGFIPLAGTATTAPITGKLHFNNVSGILINSNNIDLNIWEVVGNSGSWESTFGFDLKYCGTGGANLNDLVLNAHNQSSTHVEVFRIHQNGVTEWKTTFGLSNLIIGYSVYSATSTYAIGARVLYQGTLYQCSTKIETAEAWTSGHWTALTSGGLYTNKLSTFDSRILIKEASAISFRENSSYYTNLRYDTAGNEALILGFKNAATSFVVKSGDSGTTQTSTTGWQSLTPSIQVKGQSLYVNSLIAQNVTPAYNFYVNGTANITGALTASNLWNIDAKTAASYTLSNTAWTEACDLPTDVGSYMIQLSCNNVIATGVFSIGGSDTAKDEISLHVNGAQTTWRIYARTEGAKLKLASTDDTATSRSVTVKFKRIM